MLLPLSVHCLNKLSMSLFSQMHKKEQVGSWILVINSIRVPPNEPPRSGAPGNGRWDLVIYLAHSGAFLETVIAAFSSPLFPFGTTEAMAMDPKAPSSLLFCKNQSGSEVTK